MRKALALAAAWAATSCSTTPTSVPKLMWSSPWPKVELVSVLQTTADIPMPWLRRVVGSGAEPLFVRPYGVAWLGEDLLVVDSGARRVLRFAAGSLLRSPEGAFAEPLFVATTPSGVAVSDPSEGRVVLLDQALRPKEVLAEDLQHPTGLAWVAGGLWVAETAAHQLRCLGPVCPRPILGQRGIGKGELNFPTALAASGTTLWVADTLNFRIQGFDINSGEVKAVLGGLGDGPGSTPRTKGLAVDGEGQLWVSDGVLNQVSVFSPAGQLLTCLGGDALSAPLFSMPAGMAARGREIAVADALARRIVVFRVKAQEGP
ncbi:MAG: hypothetical protein ACK42L_07380 [Thermoanaerobaculum sp.]